MARELYVAPTAHVEKSARIAADVHIGRQACVESGVILGHNVHIGQSSQIGRDTKIEADVIIGPHVRIGWGALIKEGAKICPNKVRSVSSDGRKLENWVIVGSGVLLHDEVELDDEAIVPNQRTIASIGSFGSKNRVVTIYGSDQGPRYSVGCQMGISFSELGYNVVSSINTTTESANTYAPYMGIFNEIGSQVQLAYEKETVLVEELKEERSVL